MKPILIFGMNKVGLSKKEGCRYYRTPFYLKGERGNLPVSHGLGYPKLIIIGFPQYIPFWDDRYHRVSSSYQVRLHCYYYDGRNMGGALVA